MMEPLINLVIHTDPPQTIPLNYFPHETVGSIKEVVSKYCCIPFESLHVFFGDVALQNDWTLGQSNVTHLSEIHVFVQNNYINPVGAAGANESSYSINTQFQVEELYDFLEQGDIITCDNFMMVGPSSNQNIANAPEDVLNIQFPVEQQPSFGHLNEIITSDNFMMVGPSSNQNIANAPEDVLNIQFPVEQPTNFVKVNANDHDCCNNDNNNDNIIVGYSNQNTGNTNDHDHDNNDNNALALYLSAVNTNDHDYNNNYDNNYALAHVVNTNDHDYRHNHNYFYNNNDNGNNNNALAPYLSAVNTNDHDYNNNYDNALAPSPVAVRRARTEDETITVIIVSRRGDEQNPKEFGVEVRTKSRVRHLRSRLRSLVDEGFFPDLDLPTESEGYVFVHRNLIMEENRSFGWHDVWDGEYIYIFRALVEY